MEGAGEEEEEEKVKGGGGIDGWRREATDEGEEA